MNHRVKKNLDDFILTEQELLCTEKALYALLDQFKNDRINNGNKRFPMDYFKIIDQCLAKIKLHENFVNNRNFFEIEMPYLDPDPVEEILGENSLVRQKVYAMN